MMNRFRDNPGLMECSQDDSPHLSGPCSQMSACSRKNVRARAGIAWNQAAHIVDVRSGIQEQNEWPQLAADTAEGRKFAGVIVYDSRHSSVAVNLMPLPRRTKRRDLAILAQRTLAADVLGVCHDQGMIFVK